MKLQLHSLYYRLINALVIVVFTTLPTMSQTLLYGTVRYFNSGSRPAAGVSISAFGTNTVYTSDAGMFILGFPNRKPGDPVRIIVGAKDRDGKALELVNAKELEQIHLPSNAEMNPIDVIVCRAGERNEAAKEYYDIIVKTADAALNRRLMGIERLLKQDNIDSITFASLYAEKEKIRNERDSAVEKAEVQALYIANINLDRASTLVKAALKELNEEKNLLNAIVILDNEKLIEAYKNAYKKEIRAKGEIIQVIEGFKLKILLLIPTFDNKAVNQCCFELEQIYKNESHYNIDEPYCFTWAINYPQTKMQWPNQVSPEAIAVAFDSLFVSIELGDSITLKPIFKGATVDSFIWSPTYGLINPNSLTPIVYSFNSQTYTLTVFDTNGFSSSAYITVLVDPNRNVYIPNVFQPGSQNKLNDHFNIYVGRGVAKVNYFRIYDRWGELMYERTNFLPDIDNLSEGWDGKSSGEYVQPGVFVYIAEVKFLDGRVLIYRGDVTVIR